MKVNQFYKLGCHNKWIPGKLIILHTHFRDSRGKNLQDNTYQTRNLSCINLERLPRGSVKISTCCWLTCQIFQSGTQDRFSVLIRCLWNGPPTVPTVGKFQSSASLETSKLSLVYELWWEIYSQTTFKNRFNEVNFINFIIVLDFHQLISNKATGHQVLVWNGSSVLPPTKTTRTSCPDKSSKKKF